MKLSHVIDGFFIVRRAQLAPTTLTNYRYCYNKLLAYFGPEQDFPAITPSAMRSFVDNLRATGLSEHSIHDNLTICSASWTFAANEFGFPHIVRGIEKPKYSQKMIVGFTNDEVKALLRGAEWSAGWDPTQGKRTKSKRPTARRDVAIMLTLLDTGLRVSELCALTLQDYHKDNRRLHIRHGKGNKERHLYAGVAAHLVSQATQWPLPARCYQTTQQKLPAAGRIPHLRHWWTCERGWLAAREMRCSQRGGA